MKRGKVLTLVSIVLTTVILSSCGGLNKMKKNYGMVNYTVTPTVLEEHADSVEISITGKFPEKYFNKKAMADITPVLKWEGGEKAFKTVKVQGEAVQDNNTTIGYVSGGSFTYTDKISYEEAMRMSNLEARVDAYIATKPDKKLAFDVKEIAEGVIATPLLVIMKGKVIFGADNFQRITSDSKNAEILYNIQQAQVRSTELRKDEIKALVDYIKEAKENERKEFTGVSVSSYASPDGAEDLNTKLADNRSKSADKYVQKQFKKIEEANKDNFVSNAVTAEDWDGFKQLVQASDIADKDLILKVLSMYSDSETREKEIKNISAVYVELAKDILPKLRRSKINVNVNLIGYSDEEITAIFNAKPDSLNVEELLYAATLTQDEAQKLNVYTKCTEIYPKEWRGFNNKGVILFNQDKFDEAKQSFEGAKEIDNTNAKVLNNLGAIELVKGNVAAAKELFITAGGAGSEVNYNNGIVAVKEADYANAVTMFGDNNSFNSGLAKLLNGDNDGAVKAADSGDDKDNAMNFYLKAIAGARGANTDLLFNNLRAAIEKDVSLKAFAKSDMEFAKYFNDTTFKSVIE
jgi:Flp pilus assembly protein TadD